MPERRTKAGVTALTLLVLIALAAYGLDQFTKYLVVENLTPGEIVPVLGPVLEWQFVRNPGAAFSMASGMTWIFTILAAAVITVIIWFAGKIKSTAWAVVFGLLLGGVLGNLTDRLFREPSFGLGHVVDFISTPWLLPAIYNVADICIVSSMVLFLILSIRGIGLDGTRETKDGGGSTSDAAEPAAEAAPSADADSIERPTGSTVDGDEPAGDERADDERGGRAYGAVSHG
ncbi:signal peptidase II [Agromyces seonyuensis]|uniref:Lipoprotein signal peptidase n=1 Tax=Agromyces seonyuensis TaxID=2662446 RepID=A0A6I4NW54_9MICO|nr:signal peptidase II [Agromyces seonyuensis]